MFPLNQYQLLQSFVVGCWLLVVGGWWLVVCCLLLVVGGWWLVGCLLLDILDLLLLKDLGY
ncbi:MAG TPA: hypothetical protein DCL61_32995 [Cyanobacteria bacterium UBA12227]|nr:hypothetical protein [Cyanobacteria bacterium UBA12227]HAX88139.1 hypothetical protein [Cyanobacteria bacterium UBA11370]